MQKSYASMTVKEIKKREKVLAKIPPNWEVCMHHRKAQYLYDMPLNFRIDQFAYCECCGEPYDAPRIKVCTDTRKMGVYGFGLTLYFLFENFVARLFGMLCIPGVLSLAAYIATGYAFGERIGDVFATEGKKVGAFYGWWSFSFCSQKYVGPLLMASCIGFCVVYYFGSVMVSRLTYKEANLLDTKQLDPTDYSIMLQGLPVSNLDEEHFLECFCNYVEIKKEDIIRYVYTHDISKFSIIKQKHEELQKIKQLVDKYRISLASNGVDRQQILKMYPKSVTGCRQKFKDYEDLLDKIKRLRTQLSEMQKTPDSYLKDAPILFITFNKTATKDRVIEKYKTGILKKHTINYIGGKYTFTLESAQAPDSIIWDNLHVTTQTARSVFTWFITMLIIAGSFAGNYLLKKNGEKYAIQMAKTSDIANVKVKVFTLLSSVFIAIINVIVIIVMPILTKLENHITVTNYQSSTSFKLALAQFINSALVPLIINYKQNSYFSGNGLIDQAIFNWLFLLFTTPLIEIFDIPNIISHVMMCIVKRKGSKSELMQSEANKVYLPPKQPMHLKYSNILLLVYYSAFYIQLWPPGILLFLIGLYFNYLSDKILTVKRYSRTELPSESIAIFTSNTVVGGIILIVVSNLIYVFQFENTMAKKFIYGLVPIAIFIIIALLSVFLFKQGDKRKKCSKFAECFFWKQSEVNEVNNTDYDLLVLGDEDYMALNPLTRKKALLEQIERKLKDPQGREADELNNMKMKLINNDDVVVFAGKEIMEDVKGFNSIAGFNAMEACASIQNFERGNNTKAIVPLNEGQPFIQIEEPEIVHISPRK